MKQLYEVGEEITLQSKMYPEYNGNYIVEAVLKKGDSHTCRLSGKFYPSIKSELFYLLDTPHLNADKKEELVWLQSALRKIHKPSTQSFTELMSVLKMPNKVLGRV